MNVLVVPYGMPGWTERKRVLEGIASRTGAPPFRYDDVLIIVPSSRLRRTYGKLFLDHVEGTHGHAPVIPPPTFLSPAIREIRAPLAGAYSGSAGLWHAYDPPVRVSRRPSALSSARPV